jgi:hypothetical protein
MGQFSQGVFMEMDLTSECEVKMSKVIDIALNSHNINPRKICYVIECLYAPENNIEEMDCIGLEEVKAIQLGRKLLKES